MENIKRLLVVMICAIMLCGCTKEEKQETVNFDEKFCESVVEIQYVSFENEKIVYTDKEIISELLNILKSAKFDEKKKEDYVEGMYTLYLISEDTTTQIGFEPETIAINGVQFYADKQIKTSIFECLDIE